jgi:hypothetical protein
VPPNLNGALSPVFAIALDTVSNLSNVGTSQSFVPEDEVAADPASLGTAVLLAGWTGQSGADYNSAAQGELTFLYSNSVPKTQDGAWSHRTDKLQLW